MRGLNEIPKTSVPRCMMKIRTLLFITFLLICISPLHALNEKSISARADYITYNPEKIIFVANGDATVSFQGLELTAGTICMDGANSRIVASNNVFLRSELGEISCSSISINLYNKKCYMITSDEDKPKVQFDAATFQITGTVTDFPKGTFFIENIVNSDVCVTGTEIVVHPNETAQIRPAAFWVNGNRSMELPFYSFTIGAGSTYASPRVAYTDLGATIDIPVIVSLEEKSMSIAHMKYNGDAGFSVSLEHQQRFSDNANATVYLDDVNSDKYRKARMIYRHKFGTQTDGTLNVDWQNNKDLDVFFNMSHRFSHSYLTFNLKTQNAVSQTEGNPTSFDLSWRQTPDDFLGSPVIYSFSAGLAMTGTQYDKPGVWNKNIGLNLTHKPIKLGETSSLIFGAGDTMSWLSNGENRNNITGNMTLNIGTKFSVDAYLNRYSYDYNGLSSKLLSGNIGVTTRFTNEFSTRLAYSFVQYDAAMATGNFSYSTRLMRCGFNYNPSQNFQLSLEGTYDLQLSRMRYAQGNVRFRVGKYFFLTLRPYYDFIIDKSTFNFQVDPILGQ